MSDYAAQFERSYINLPPRGYPGNRVQPPNPYSYPYSSPQRGYAPRFDYYNSPMRTQSHYANAELQRTSVGGRERVHTDIQKQWSYATKSGGSSHPRRATDPLPPVPMPIQGTAGMSRYPYSVSSSQNTPVKHNPSTSIQYNPVHRSKSLAVPRPRVQTAPQLERSNTPPLNRRGRDEKGMTSWNRTELNKPTLPESLASNSPMKVPETHQQQTARDLTLADILVESMPAEKSYEANKPVSIEHARRRSSDDILDSAKYIQENRPIDQYVSLTGTRKKVKTRRVSDPFAGLLPGKSQSADRLDSQGDSPQTGLRSRQESLEQLRGSYNNSDSAFTARVDHRTLPSPTSSEEELRDITGLVGGTAVKRSKSMDTHKGPKVSSFSPRHARVKILSNDTSSSMESPLHRKQGDKGKESGEAYNSPVYARVDKKRTLQKESEGTRTQCVAEKRPQPSTTDPTAIRRALIEELKSGNFNLSSRREPQYAVVKKDRGKVSSELSYKSSDADTMVEKGIQAARAGDLEALTAILMSEHIESPHSIDKRTAIHRKFNLFTDAETESNLVHISSESGTANCLKWLVLFAPDGACVALNKDRFVPAILAIRKGSLECVKILVINGQVPLTIQELGNETLLHHAAYIGQAEILKWLLDHLKETQDNVIKDSDLQDAFNVTPVHFAAQKGYLDCLQVLQDAMCNLWTMDQHQQTPMDWAIASNQDLAANFLILVRSVRYLSDQLGLERNHSQRLQEKMALVETTNSKLKEAYQEQVNIEKERYETSRKELQHDFLRINEQFLKEGKEGKPKRRRGVFRTFSLPAKHGQKKQRDAMVYSTEESSPDEPKNEDKPFPHTSNPDLAQEEPKPSDPTSSTKENGGKLSTIEEVSHRGSVLQPTEETTPLKGIQEITIAEHPHDDDAKSALSPTKQKLTDEGKLAYRGSPDPFLTEGSSVTTPDTTLQRRKRNVFGFKTPSKTSLKEDTVSRKSTEGSISSRVGESTGCHGRVVTTLRRIFSHSAREGSSQETMISLPIPQPLPPTPQPQTPPATTQSDQVTLQTVQEPLSQNIVETDFIADSEYSSHASISVLVPQRAAPDPPNFGRKASFVQATAVQESVKLFNNRLTRNDAPPYNANVPYAHSHYQYSTQPTVQHFHTKRMSYPGVVTGSQNRLHKLEPYGRQAERLLDSGYLAQSSDSLDAIRQRPRHLGANAARVTQAYSAPNAQGYFSTPSTPQRQVAQRNVSWPNSVYSPKRTASIPSQNNPYQHTQFSQPNYTTHKSTTISDL